MKRGREGAEDFGGGIGEEEKRAELGRMEKSENMPEQIIISNLPGGCSCL